MFGNIEHLELLIQILEEAFNSVDLYKEHTVELRVLRGIKGSGFWSNRMGL